MRTSLVDTKGAMGLWVLLFDIGLLGRVILAILSVKIIQKAVQRGRLLFLFLPGLEHAEAKRLAIKKILLYFVSGRVQLLERRVEVT